MNSSLERLDRNLPGEALTYTREEFVEKSMLMKRKGVYSYDFMDSFDKFKERLTSKDEFYSVLNDERKSVVKTMITLRAFAAHSKSRTWVNTMICI